MYNGYSTDHVNYRLFMGSSRMSSMALFGPYYYYSCLNNAIVYGVWDNYIKEKVIYIAINMVNIRMVLY